jgi:hypothetical protein
VSREAHVAAINELIERVELITGKLTMLTLAAAELVNPLEAVLGGSNSQLTHDARMARRAARLQLEQAGVQLDNLIEALESYRDRAL